MSAPVTITDNTAQFGGAIWSDETKLTLPADADISSNTAIFGVSFSTARMPECSVRPNLRKKRRATY